MSIPIYRHNQDHDDWEVASVYDSDDCDSLGRSAYNESLQSSGSRYDPALHLQGHLYGDTRPRVEYPVPQQQHQNYPPAPYTRPRWDARYVPGKQSSFIVPPPGVIFPRKDWVLPPQDTYEPRTPGQIASSSVDAGLVEPPSLLLSPSSPPRASSPLIRRPSPATTIAHGQPPHGMPITMPGPGTGTNINTYASPMMPPPPRYHEVAHPISPRLAEAGCQAHSSTVMNPPRRSGHDVFPTPYAPGGPGRASMPMPRGAQSSEEMTVVDGRYGGGQPIYGPGDRPDLHPLAQAVPSKYGYERERDAAGRTRTAWPQTRERRPSVWRRFVRRFTVGQT